ncbi:MAG: valine--tRNA ligase [Methanomicrobiales archaeon]|nr:valine--tRNA ligase [Methanomicrobiales archaeon]
MHEKQKDAGIGHAGMTGEIPKHYDYAEVETRWQQIWKDSTNYFDPVSEKPQFVIDTPPPYPTGNFHIGNALNWCYIDFIARYRRMQGNNVMFPQGWDCHGLPTEVKVEETFGITKNDVPREEFRRMCRELTTGNIEKMRRTLRRLGFSIDWSHEYVTMHPEYYGKTQLSFLRMLRDGYIYQTEHPVNFCTRCETAIAFAEVVYESRKTVLSYFDFDGVRIATTRPELLAACGAVAVHPADERYHHLKGKTLCVPFFGHRVPVLLDEAVDPAFGTGAVMICTFGDKQDVHWWKQYGLELRKGIDRKGQMTGVAGKYRGLTVKECRDQILSDMREEGILSKQEPAEQRVGVCWRCKTPIEILSERQWFVRIKSKEILDAAHDVCWNPPHMLTRMENWVASMEWDWCISRQRIFASPIPVWFCCDCGEMILPREEDLPIDPTRDCPPEPCPKCGGSKFTGEEDVLDTWMDSSISVLNVTGWTGAGNPPHFPAQLRPQGHDIIRTWAFYSILRSVALTGSRPWDAILVNGMVLGEDGFKMSKSRGNIIAPEEIVDKYGADALRQWGAVGAATGSDIMFSWTDVVAASRFQTKLWNISRFAFQRLSADTYDRTAPVTALADRWLLTRLSDTVEAVSMAMESYQFDIALKAVREFAWSVLADDYIEIAKGRLYMQGPARDSACRALEITLETVYRLLAPFIPHFSEECYHFLRPEGVHAQAWPDFSFDDHAAREQGEMMARIIAEVRRFKHDRGMALNAPLGLITIYNSPIGDDAGDTARALNAAVEFRGGEPALERTVADIVFNKAVVGKTFRKKAGAFMEAVRSLPPEALLNPPATIRIDGEETGLPGDAFTPKIAFSVAGKTVDLLTVGGATVTIQQSP